jgi:hypothetical protein
MPLTSIVGLTGMALLASALAGRVARGWLPGRRARIGVVAMSGVLMLLPVGGLSVAGYLRGVIGDLSITTLALLVSAITANVTGRAWFGARERAALTAVVLVVGGCLYPLALGAGRLDPYVLGYGSYALVSLLLAAVLLAWQARMDAVIACMLAGVIAYLTGLLESENLWDYLIDPLLVSYAAAVWTGRAGAALRPRRSEGRA